MADQPPPPAVFEVADLWGDTFRLDIDDDDSATATVIAANRVELSVALDRGQLRELREWLTYRMPYGTVTL